MAIYNFNIHAASANDLKQLLSELKLSQWLRDRSSIRKTTLPFKDGNDSTKTKVETVWTGRPTRRPATMQNAIEAVMTDKMAANSGRTFDLGEGGTWTPGADIQAQDRLHRPGNIVTPKMTVTWPTLRSPAPRDRMGGSTPTEAPTDMAKASADSLHFNGALRISLAQTSHGPEAAVTSGYVTNVFTPGELEREAQAILALAKKLRGASDAHTRKQRGGFYK